LCLDSVFLRIPAGRRRSLRSCDGRARMICHVPEDRVPGSVGHVAVAPAQARTNAGRPRHGSGWQAGGAGCSLHWRSSAAPRRLAWATNQASGMLPADTPSRDCRVRPGAEKSTGSFDSFFREGGCLGPRGSALQRPGMLEPIGGLARERNIHRDLGALADRRFYVQ
jgi:hypothetical protein